MTAVCGRTTLSGSQTAEPSAVRAVRRARQVLQRKRATGCSSPSRALLGPRGPQGWQPASVGGVPLTAREQQRCTQRPWLPGRKDHQREPSDHSGSVRGGETPSRFGRFDPPKTVPWPGWISSCKICNPHAPQTLMQPHATLMHLMQNLHA